MSFTSVIKNNFSQSGVDLRIHLNFGLIDTKDNRSILTKIKDIVLTIFNEICILFNKFISRLYAKITKQRYLTPVLNTVDGKYHYPDADLPWSKDEESKGLFLCLHGLHGHPSDFQKYATKHRQENQGAHVCVPFIAKSGNCALKISGDPVLELVEKYLEKFPGNPVTIIGTSNGGRIAQYVESRLDHEMVNQLSVVTLAGLHFGTTFIAFLERLRLLWIPCLDSELTKEFRWNSPMAQAELKLWSDKQKIWDDQDKKVRHLFCATTNDEHVWTNSSSLPYSQHSTHSYSVYSGQSHSSIVPYALPEVFKWLTLGCHKSN
ncbi:MAG: hypothetical protein H0W50_03800 [Parachlamydiaceae bacterium]|nr:hypothetical protein [Parachlamydiaceae bacterium]